MQKTGVKATNILGFHLSPTWRQKWGREQVSQQESAIFPRVGNSVVHREVLQTVMANGFMVVLRNGPLKLLDNCGVLPKGEPGIFVTHAKTLPFPFPKVALI